MPDRQTGGGRLGARLSAARLSQVLEQLICWRVSGEMTPSDVNTERLPHHPADRSHLPAFNEVTDSLGKHRQLLSRIVSSIGDD